MGTHAIPLGGTAAGGQRNVGITTKLSDVAVNLTVLLCAKVRNSPRRDGSGTAAGPQNMGIPTIPGCRRDRIPRLGIIIIYQGGSGYVLEGVRILLRMSSLPT